MAKDNLIQGSEQARSMAKKRWDREREKREIEQTKIAEKPAAILKGLGYPDEVTTPPHLLELARMASGSDNLALAAIKLLSAQGREALVWKPGDVCPTCGGQSEKVKIDLSEDTLRGIKEVFARDDDLREKYQLAEPLEVSKPDTPIQ
jgi:hypothetical protein